MSSLDLID